MLKMKNQCGITLISLAVTVIVLMIILNITVNSGKDSINSTRDRKMQAELEMIQQACISEYTKAKQLGYLENSTQVPANFVGTIIDVENLPEQSIGWFFDNNPEEAYKKYFELTPEDLEVLNILNSDYTYIVNYYTGEVYNETKENSSEQTPLYIKSVITNQENSSGDTTSFTDW